MSSIGSTKLVLKAAALAGVATIVWQGRAAAAPPVPYVRVCDLYGSGFFQIPGNDTCIRVSGGVHVGGGGATSRFDVTPAFDVNGSGVAWGADATLLFGVRNTGLSIGPRIAYFGGEIGGSTYYPFSGGNYTVTNRGILAGDITAQFTPSAWGGTSLRAFVGIADVRTQTEFGVVRTFVHGYDTNTNVGFTTGAGFSTPLPSISNALSLTGEVRYITTTHNINVPGSVDTRRDIVIGTVGLEWAFIQQPGWKQ